MPLLGQGLFARWALQPLQLVLGMIVAFLMLELQLPMLVPMKAVATQ
jgi:hypothetical protein